MSTQSRTRRTSSNINKGNTMTMFPENLTTKEAKLALAKHIMKKADKHNRDIQVHLSEPSRRPTPAQLSPPLGLYLDPHDVVNEMNQQEATIIEEDDFSQAPSRVKLSYTLNRVVSIRNLGTPTAKYAIGQLDSREENSLEPYNLRLAQGYSGTPLVSPVGSPLRDEYFPPLINRQSDKDNQAKGKSTKRKSTKLNVKTNYKT